MQPESTTDGQRPGRSRRWLYMVIGLGIGLLFLYLTARNVNLQEASAAIYAVNPLWILPLTLVYILTFVLRGLRWQLMFPDDSRPSRRHAIDGYMIGRALNNLLPGRLGEVVRASIIGRALPRVGFSGSIATIVLEKLFDLLAVLLLLGIALLSAPLPEWLNNTGVALFAAIPTLLLGLILVDRADARIAFPGDQAHTGMVQKLLGFVRGMLQKFSTGLFALRSAQHFALLCALTLFIWAWEVVIMYFCLAAFSIDAPFAASLVALVFLCVGVMLPTAPGFIGTYQLFIVAALQLYSVPDSSAFALSIFLNLLTIVLTTVLGLLALVFEGGLFNLREVLRYLSR